MTSDIIPQIYKDPNDKNNPYIGSNWSVEDLLTAFSQEVNKPLNNLRDLIIIFIPGVE